MFSELTSRNNTSFPKELYETIKSMQIDKNDALRYHQRIVVDYLLKYNIRGVLAYHKMGSGKTIVAVSTCVELLDADYNVIFLASKSLHNNFKDDIRKYHTLSQSFAESHPNLEEFIDDINFVSLNASNMMTQMRRTSSSLVESGDHLPNLEGTFLVIDEAHNFFNSISNESKNATGLYEMIMRTRNIKILFLTGSPIINHPFEIAICYNMLAGLNKNKSLFGDSFSNFSKYYIDDSGDKVTVKHADKFSDRIFGLTSYFGADSVEQKAMFPRAYDMVKQLIHMSSEQYSMYMSAREQEMKEAGKSTKVSYSKKFGKPEGSSSSYRVNSRQFSNVLYPDNAIEITRIGSNIKVKRFPEKLTVVNLTDELSTWSPKILAVVRNMAMHSPPGILDDLKPSANMMKKIIANRRKREPDWVVGIGNGFAYSQFLDSGVTFLGKVLEAYGMVRIDNTDELYKYLQRDTKHGSYVVISGEMDVETRSELIRVYNSEENIQSRVISTLLVTSTGAEGIDLKNGRHGHILDPYWNYSRISQVMARLIRAKSHVLLPEGERTVQFYIYISIYPKNVTKIEDDKKESNRALHKIEITTDQSLYEKSVKNQSMINAFYKVIIESSIDCMIHYGESDTVKCRLCAPTGKQLWFSGQQGSELPSPCEKLTESSIVAHAIEYDGVEYMYHVKDNLIHIFLFDNMINSYREIFPDHAHYSELYDAIDKKIHKK